MAEYDTETMSPEEMEAEARRQGWRPESEWDDARAEKEGRRKPTSWLTAEEYLHKTANNIPLLNKQLKTTTQKLSLIEQDLAEEKKARAEEAKKVDEMHAILSDQRRISKEAIGRAREQGRKEAEAQAQEAVLEGDAKKHAEAQERLKTIHKEEMDEAVAAAKAPVKKEEDNAGTGTQRKQPDDVTQRWVSENKWFREDAVLNSAMMANHRDVMEEYPDMPLYDQYQEAAKRTENELPHRFQKLGVTKREQEDDDPPPRRQASVNRPSWKPGGGRDDTPEAKFDRIPQADKDAYTRAAAMIEKTSGGKEKFTKAQFMQEYE